MLELIENTKQRIYRILSDDIGIPEKELEAAGETGREEIQGPLPLSPVKTESHLETP